MKVQFIFTFEKLPQIITEYEDIFRVFIDSKEIFIAYAMSHRLLTRLELQSMIKISSCIVDTSMPVSPKWYDECRGKFWLDDLEQFRRENKIKSSVTKEYIDQWMKDNA